MLSCCFIVARSTSSSSARARDRRGLSLDVEIGGTDEIVVWKDWSDGLCIELDNIGDDDSPAVEACNVSWSVDGIIGS